MDSLPDFLALTAGRPAAEVEHALAAAAAVAHHMDRFKEIDDVGKNEKIDALNALINGVLDGTDPAIRAGRAAGAAAAAVGATVPQIDAEVGRAMDQARPESGR